LSVERLHSIESAVKGSGAGICCCGDENSTRLMCESGVVVILSIANKSEVGSSGPLSIPTRNVRTVATRTAWRLEWTLVLPQGAGMSAGCWLRCPVSSLAASADARRDHGQDERIHSLCQLVQSRTDRTARGCKARATGRLRDNTLDTRRIRSNAPRQRRAPFQVAPSHDEKRGDGTEAVDIFAPGSTL